MKLFATGGGAVTSTSPLGATNMNSTIASANLKDKVTDADSDGDGSFQINGVTIDFNVNSDTVQDIMNRVNSSAAGATMTFNSAADQFTLTNNETGAIGLTVSESSGGLLEALGLNSTSTPVAGANAVVQVNNGTQVTTTSNTFDQSVTGVAGLTVTAASTGSQTVTVGNDTSNATTAINNFINAYNALQSFIDSESTSSTDSSGKVTAGTLAGDRDVSDLSSSMRALVFNAVSGVSGTIQRRDDIGIGFTSSDPTMTITDQSKLTNALQNNPQGVAALFNTQPGGLVQEINNFVNNANSSSGLIATETTELTQQNNNLQDQINSLETKVTNDQTQMTNEYEAMETALSKIQSESQTLDAYFGTTSSSSSTSSSGTSSSSSTSSSSTSGSSTTS
jgi:flagellar hook-associated protein 2